MPLVYILLLNYRGTDDTLACLDSLRQLNYPNYRIIVIDNASPDDSVARLQTRLNEYPDEFHFIRSTQNLGFSGGNNLGLRYALEMSESQAGADADAYVWLLNNDTTVDTDSLTPMVEEVQRTGGLAGSLLLHPDGRYQQVGSRINWWTGSVRGYREDQVSNGMAVDTLIGASLLIPCKALRQAGLWNESFFLYFEDGEYSVRCARLGFSLTVATASRIFHKEGATTGRKSRLTQYYYHRNRLACLLPYANPLQKIGMSAYTAFRFLRSGVKSMFDPERRIAFQIQRLALQDFLRGIRGPCPHNLDTLT